MGREQCIKNSPWMTDRPVSRETEFEVDIESEGTASEENGRNDIVSANNQGWKLLNIVWSGPPGFDALKSSSKCCHLADQNVDLLYEKNSEGQDCKQEVAFVKKQLVDENPKTKANRKAPKPPRPPNGPSLDAADQKLVEEITEFAMRKRARIERLKMLKKMRAAKSSSWNSSLFALIITVLFCFIILYQGICTRNGKSMYNQESPEPAVAANEDLITIEFFKDSAHKYDEPGSISPDLAGEPVSGSRMK